MPRPSSARSVWPLRVALGAWLATMIFRPAMAPATIAEQRARLPPAAECSDPVEGRWKGIAFEGWRNQWYDATLEIRKVEGSDTQLTGMIYIHMWTGGEQATEPTGCDQGLRFKLKMTGAGSYDKDKSFVHFGGTSWELQEEICGFMGGYNLDQYTGTIDPEIQEFQSVNNDGGAAVNSPTVFRRIGCLEETPKANVDVTPPPFYPERKSSGC
jgi:hypothetical protein